VIKKRGKGGTRDGRKAETKKKNETELEKGILDYLKSAVGGENGLGDGSYSLPRDAMNPASRQVGTKQQWGMAKSPE